MQHFAITRHTLHNSTQLYTSLQYCTIFYQTLQDFRIMFNTLQAFTILYKTTLHDFAVLYNIFNISHNSTRLYKALPYYSILYNTLHDSTIVYNTLHNCTQLYTTIQNFTKIARNFTRLVKAKSLQHFTPCYTIAQNF